MTLRRLLPAMAGLFLAHGASGAASTQIPAPADPMLAAIVRDIESPPFGARRAIWERQFPLAAWVFPRGLIFRGDWEPAPLWCAISRDSIAGMTREVVFYANRADLPLDCRVEQIRFEIPPADATAGRQASLSERFTDQRGQPRTIPGPPNNDRSRLAPLEIDVARYAGLELWSAEDIMYWPGAESDVFVFRHNGALQVVVRTHGIYPRWNFDRPLLVELATAVRARFPEAARLLSVHASVDSTAALRAVVPVLSALETASDGEERLLLSLVASCLLEKLEIFPAHDDFSLAPDVPALAPYNVRLEQRGHGGSSVWGYDYDLITRVVEEYPDLRWGQLAFIDTLNPERPSCETNYKDAIATSRQWLGAHPSSPLAPRVLFKMAQAYDTWWSLALVPEEDAADEIVYPAEHRSGAVEARAMAAVLYRRFLRLEPTSPDAEDARRRLTLLLSGVDTRQRAFYCAIP